MRKSNAIAAARERAYKTKRPWYIGSADGHNWELSPKPPRTALYHECGPDGVFEDEEEIAHENDR
jgi:hypothetical protein